MQEENNTTESVAKSKRMSFSKKGLGWYTFLSFLFVTLMIFIAVMLTYSNAEKTLGGIYSKQIALRSLGLNESEVTALSAEQTYFNGAEAFKVSVTANGVEHVVYVDSATARVCENENQVQTPSPEATADGIHPENVG